MMLRRLLWASVHTSFERPLSGHGAIALLTEGERKNLTSFVNSAQLTE